MDGDRAGLLERLLNGVSGKVSVIGSMNADYSIRVKHLPHPGETVRGDEIKLTPGGKSANQAVCAATLGADVMKGCLMRESDKGGSPQRKWARFLAVILSVAMI